MIDTLALPDEINHDFFETFLRCILDSQERRQTMKTVPPLKLYCCCDGGESRPTLGIVELIRMDGDVEGILLGAAVSSAAVIWSACQKRIVYPLGRMAIHPVAWSTSSPLNQQRLQSRADEFDWVNKQQCAIFTAASNQSFDWWYQKYMNTPELEWFDAETLVSLGMAEMWKGEE